MLVGMDAELLDSNPTFFERSIQVYISLYVRTKKSATFWRLTAID